MICLDEPWIPSVLIRLVLAAEELRQYPRVLWGCHVGSERAPLEQLRRSAVQRLIDPMSIGTV